MGSSLIIPSVASWGQLLGTATLTAEDGSIEVTGIPAGFRYLMVFLSLNFSPSGGKPAEPPLFVLNNDTTVGNYKYLRVCSTRLATTPAWYTVTGNIVGANVWDSGFFTNHQMVISNIPAGYPRQFHLTGGGTYDGLDVQVVDVQGEYAGTTDITRVKAMATGGQLMAVGTTMTVYGLN